MINILKHIFGTKMYLITILPFLYLSLINNILNYGFNKTIGWAYDISGKCMFSQYFIFSFFIGFSFLTIIKAKTNWILSILLFLTYVFFCLIQDNNINIIFLDKILIFMTFLFIIIFIQSIIQKTIQIKS
ncbi:hypothetical protein SAMN05444005_10734 [Flavobacterium urocaniciphilum]|uniref:Uncharacterized protein n=1 Tax=Flavobacterium urocaniciphilum TaxID=1299341 RepID=A0A1H9DGF8_9FLAO|nr:hypothetical protein SAMN05444005_10734 [Flavobacterium urocaniciphilum]